MSVGQVCSAAVRVTHCLQQTKPIALLVSRVNSSEVPSKINKSQRPQQGLRDRIRLDRFILNDIAQTTSVNDALLRVIRSIFGSRANADSAWIPTSGLCICLG